MKPLKMSWGQKIPKSGFTVDVTVTIFGLHVALVRQMKGEIISTRL